MHLGDSCHTMFPPCLCCLQSSQARCCAHSFNGFGSVFLLGFWLFYETIQTSHSVLFLKIFCLTTLERVAQRGCRICILGGIQNQARQSPDLRWHCLDRGLDQIISKGPFKPKSSYLSNFSGCASPFLTRNSETLLLTYPVTWSLPLSLPGLLSILKGDYSIYPLLIGEGEVLHTFAHPCCPSLYLY